MLHDVSSALSYLHAHHPPILHLDIKPDNILIHNNGSFMLTDFGISDYFPQFTGEYSPELTQLVCKCMEYYPWDRPTANDISTYSYNKLNKKCLIIKWSTIMVCQNCGQKSQPNETICSKCGQPLLGDYDSKELDFLYKPNSDYGSRGIEKTVLYKPSGKTVKIEL